MLDPTVFHPRMARWKEPFGAVVPGTQVRFTVGRCAKATGCALCLHEEFSGKREEVPMLPCAEGWRITYTAPAQAELVWYFFRFSFEDGGTDGYGTDGFAAGGAPEPFQLTVFDDSAPTPDWFGRGVTYQIFPDRFCRLETPSPAGMIGDRRVHENWYEGMDYLPEDGEIRNRDFFGGSLKGILSRLDYLESLHVSAIYLNPIFEAASNHRYDTCDYRAIDPMLGTEQDFRLLCAEAKKRGIRIILDGVFNHTGSASRYFNAAGWYDTLGAAQSRESPWFDWYDFTHWPDRYSSWWGVDTLPQVNESAPSYLDYIIREPDSVVRHWLRAGASGWRLDVADELPDSFIEALRTAAVEEKSNAVVIGEVWEDGSNKIAYGRRRKYLLGRECHGLMNYPFRVSAIAWLQGGDARDFMECMETIREHYPRPAFYSALNSLGTHDNPRILTLCGQSEDLSRLSRDERAHYRLSPAERQRGVRRVMLAAALLYTFPGSPTVFYGDEAGVEGCEDPFNRAAFPWGREDPVLLRHYRALGRLRSSRISLQRGEIRYLRAEGGLLVFERREGGERTVTALNNGAEAAALTLPWDAPLAEDALTHQRFQALSGTLHITLPPENGMVLL